MVEAGPVAYLDIEFQDRDNNVAQCRLYVPFSASPTDGLALALHFVDVVAGVSNGNVLRIAMSYKYAITDQPPPGESSNVRTLSLWLFQNIDDEINAVSIPSPRSAIFEQTGNYAGIRLDMLNAQVLYFGDITASFAVTQDARNLGILVTGGLML